VQQACAAPDAVELRNLVDVLEAPHSNLEPTVVTGQAREFGGGIERIDPEAGLCEGPGIPPRAATRVEDARTRH